MRPIVIYWVTRDSDETGALCPYVDVWLERPTLHRVTAEGGIMWLDSELGTARRHCRAPINAVRAWGHTVPETDRECIRVETVGSAQK